MGLLLLVFRPPPPLVGAGGIVFNWPCLCPSVSLSIWDTVSTIFPVCNCALIDFLQTFVASASWERDELIRLWIKKVKGQGHNVITYAENAILGGCFCDISSMHWQIFSKL